jgi:hypothetical protein
MTGLADRSRRMIAGLATQIAALLSLWLPVMLPPYLTDRVLAGGDTVELRLPLHKPQAPNPLRVPYEYVFEVDGQEYRGTEFLSEDAVIWDPDTESASARVVYSKHDPSHHRMEPTTTIGGIRWVGIFPWLATLIMGVSLSGWLAASWEHLDRLIRMPTTDSRPEGDAAMILLNLVAATALVVLPAAGMATLLGWTGGNAFYRPYIAWSAALAVVSCGILLAAAWAGRHLESRTS